MQLLFIEKQRAIYINWIDLLKKEQTQHCTHVDHNQFDPFTTQTLIHQYAVFLRGCSGTL